MTCLRYPSLAHGETLFWLAMHLRLGPTPVDPTEEELEAGWELVGEEIMRDYRGRDSRPWAGGCSSGAPRTRTGPRGAPSGQRFRCGLGPGVSG